MARSDATRRRLSGPQSPSRLCGEAQEGEAGVCMSTLIGMTKVADVFTFMVALA